MTDEQENIHAWFREQIAAALAGGLEPAARERFDAHAAECQSCAAELAATQEMERHMSALFALPRPGLEDRLIDSLRTAKERWRPVSYLHPAVGRAAAAVAAVIVLGGFGYLAQQQIERDSAPVRVSSTSNLRGIGQAVTLYSNDNHGTYLRTDLGGIGAGDRTYSYQNPFPRASVTGAGFKFNSTVDHEFGIAADKNPVSQSEGKIVLGREVSQLGDADVPVDQSKKPASANRGEEAVKRFNGANTFGGGTSISGGSLVVKDSDGDGIADQKKDFEVTAGEKSVRQRTVFWDTFSDSSVAGKENAKGIYFLPGQLAEQTPPPVPGLATAGAMVVPTQQQAKEPADTSGKPETVALNFGTAAVTTPTASPTSPPPPDAPKEPSKPVEAVTSRKIIRNGQMEFEVDRFDAAFAQVSKLTTEAGGYVGTTDSEKLPNGKVKGSITLRVSPDRLDTLVLQLRGIGDLKSQKLDANDVTKQYTDLESGLRAAKAMEERLLAIIKEGKGQIKDLLAAEKELGVWREKIEHIVGEMRYFDNQVSMSTLQITLYERDIKTPAAAQQTENIDAGMETTDVEKARADALKAIEDAKGRVIQSDLKRYDAGQFGATIVAEVPPDTAGPLLDRLKQIGKVARLDIQRKQTTDPNADSSAPVRVEKKNTRLNLSLYNLANVAPRTTSTLNLAADDVEKTYRAILDRVTKAGGRVVSSNLARNKPDQTTGQISFEVPTADADAVVGDLRAMGEVMKLTVTDNPDVNNVTAAKRGFTLQIAPIAAVPAREERHLQLAAVNVAEAREKILAAASGGGARVLTSRLDESDRNNPTALIELDIPRSAELAAIEKSIGEAGDVVSRSAQRSPDSENTLDTKVRLQLSLGSADRLPPREVTALTIEMPDVDSAAAAIQLAVSQANGRIIESNLTKVRDGSTRGTLTFEVPLDKATTLIDQAKKEGTIRAAQSSKNLQVPAGTFAKAQVSLSLVTPDTIVEPGTGPWATVRNGLATSVKALLWSLQLVVIGVCTVLPFAFIVWVGWKLLKRRKSVAPSS